MKPATISVVVPTLDEEDRIEGALRSARDAVGDGAELLVVDGGSSDATRERAAPLARVVRSEPGRGRQLHEGARAARGDVLVFLHADTRLPRASAPLLRAALDRRGTAGGCFRFGLRPPSPAVSRWRLLELGVRARTRLFGTATGDQALFASREAYRASGGYPDWPLFEDVELVRRLKRVGRFRVVPTVARTSRRRWERAGFWRTVATHWALRLAFSAGVAPGRLARWYDRLTGPRGRGAGARSPGEGPLSRPSSG